jgi:mannose-P-dolichol utilization defect 1
LLQGLGFGIIAGSTLVKLPQVATVLRARSAEGLSPLSFELETLGLAIAATYGFAFRLAFSAFGESIVSFKL